MQGDRAQSEHEQTRVVRYLDELIAHARFSAVLDAVAEMQGSGRVTPELETPVTLARCRALLGLGRWKEASETTEKKLEEIYAIEPGDRRAILEFHIAAGRAAWRLGRPSRAEEHFRAGYHISRWEFEDVAGMLRTRNLLGLCFLSAGELHRAAGEFGRGQIQAREAGLYHEEANFSLNLSIALAKLGRLESSEVELARARMLFGERGHHRGRVQTRLCDGQLLRIRGDLRGAGTQIKGALSEAEEHGFEREHVIALEYLGDVALDQHDNQAAIERYDQALVLAERLAPEGDLVPELCRRIAEVHVRIGEPNRALVTCERGLRVARRINDRFEEGATHRVMAMAHQVLGHRERAIRTAKEGIQALRKIEALYELMRVLVWSGEALLAGGDSDERRAARDHLWEARSVAMTLKLAHWVDRIERVLGVDRAPKRVPRPRSAPIRSVPRGADPDCYRVGIVTQDPRIIELVRVLHRTSGSGLPVLILGENGTGKELLARAAHSLSARSGQPFIVGHCAALPSGHIDAELFGREPGDPPSASAAGAGPGLFEAAHGGVLFLDEVSELLTGAQARLLRMIETGELRRTGSGAVRRVDARVVAASTRDLAALVRRGLFRDDLYYRLNGIRLEVPPLRDRPGDVELIARVLLERAADETRKRVSLAPGAWSYLATYGWPGNVRELKNVIDRAVALGANGSRLGVDAVRIHPLARPAAARDSGRRAEAAERSRDERRAIVEALRAHGGNQSEAARSLGGMKRTTLLYKIKRLEIRPEEYGRSASTD